jgi:hypothetical protein
MIEIKDTARKLMLAAALLFLPTLASAQSIISAGAGIGGGIGDRNHDNSGSALHALGYVMVHPPLFPIGFRADALISKVSNNGTALSLIGDAVFLAPLPLVQPYALLGYGHYGIGKEGQSSGWNAGVGVRLHLPAITVFGEARRHQRISRDLLTLGISL